MSRNPSTLIQSMLADPQSVTGPMRMMTVFRAIVEDVVDIEKRGRVRVRVPSIHGTSLPIEHLPWAERIFPDGGGNNYGDFSPLFRGDTVWVMFEGGNPALPVVIGTWYGRPNAASEAPDEAQASTGMNRRRVFKTRHGARIELGDERSDFEIKLITKRGDVLHMREADGGRGIHLTTAEGHTISLQDEEAGTGGVDTKVPYDNVPDLRDGKRTLPLPSAKTANGIVQSNTPVAGSGFGRRGILLKTILGHKVEMSDLSGSVGIHMETADGQNEITMLQGGDLTLHSDNDININADGNVVVTAGNLISLSALGLTGSFTSGHAVLSGSGNFTVTASQIDFNEWT